MQRLLGLARRAIERYNMIETGDVIAVGVSGGKDSLALLCALCELRRFYPVPFTVKALVIDPCFNNEEGDYSGIEKLCEEYGIECVIHRCELYSLIFEIRKEKNPCSMCAKMRRGILHDIAKQMGCNKIALGHHFDDVIEAVLMSMLYSSEIKTMLPKLHSTNFEGMELIRPLYKVKERDIISWSNYNGLKFLRCACRFTAESEHNEDLSKRKEMKELIKYLREKNPDADDNIFRSLHNVNMATIPGFRDSDSGELHSFLEKY